MKIKPVRSEKDYQSALKRIDELVVLNPKEGTKEFDELDIISTLVEAYEDLHYPIEAPDPVEAIKYIMQEKGLSRKDLVKYFGGSKSLVSEVMRRKRELSKRVIKALHDGLGVPYEILMA
ncbi:MAG: helix-turn-helix domain-containing protein [Bacteroidetes bacterium]|nr:helix-turn-helix domain-containing protein [Bacteroidota bacterium]